MSPQAPSHVLWRKSSYTHASGECVQVAWVSPVVAVRDSKDPGGPELLVTPENWRGLLDDVKSGTYDR